MDSCFHIWVLLIFSIIKNISCSEVEKNLMGYVVLENYHDLQENYFHQGENSQYQKLKKNEYELQDLILRGDEKSIYKFNEQKNSDLNKFEILLDISTEQEEIYKNFLEQKYFKHVEKLKEKSVILRKCNEMGKSSYNTPERFRILESLCNTIVLDFVLFLNYKRRYKMDEKIVDFKNFYVNGFSCSEDLIWTFYCEYRGRRKDNKNDSYQKYSLSWNITDVKDSSFFFDKNIEIDIFKVDNDSDLDRLYFKHKKIIKEKVLSNVGEIKKHENLSFTNNQLFLFLFIFFMGEICGVFFFMNYFNNK